MTLYDLIVEAYPELSDIKVMDVYIQLQNDSDGTGDYIKQWNYSQPIPDELQEYFRG